MGGILIPNIACNAFRPIRLVSPSNLNSDTRVMGRFRILFTAILNIGEKRRWMGFCGGCYLGEATHLAGHILRLNYHRPVRGLVLKIRVQKQSARV